MNQDTAQFTDFEHSKRVAILRSYGTTVCHVSAGELEKILKLDTSEAGVRHEFKGLSIQIHDFQVEEDLLKFLAHWIHHRDSREAINATMDGHIQQEEHTLNEEWLAYLIRAINFFDDSFTFTCDITDSLIDQFLDMLNCCGLERIDQVYQICRDSSETRILTSVFANVFVHRKKQFAQDDSTCEYDQAVQRHMYKWLADVLVNDGDWSRLPPQFQEPHEDRTVDVCFHHKHGEERDCYYNGGIVNSV
jgi:hypothetical protein